MKILTGMKFKIGDKVRVKKGYFQGLENEICFIHEVNPVIFNIKDSTNTFVLEFAANELELVQPAIQAPQSFTFASASVPAAYQPAYTDFGYVETKSKGWSGTVKLDLNNKKCECGSHSVGVDRHSDYCPLYIKS